MQILTYSNGNISVVCRDESQGNSLVLLRLAAAAAVGWIPQGQDVHVEAEGPTTGRCNIICNERQVCILSARINPVLIYLHTEQQAETQYQYLRRSNGYFKNNTGMTLLFKLSISKENCMPYIYTKKIL